jgi:hypothetical protein
MKTDDFKAFYNQRKEALLQRIEQATGKTINRQVQVQTDLIEANTESEEEEEEQE